MHPYMPIKGCQSLCPYCKPELWHAMLIECWLEKKRENPVQRGPNSETINHFLVALSTSRTQAYELT